MKKRNLTRSAKLAAIASFSLIMVGCGGAVSGGSDDDGDDVVKVGLLVPETGTYASLGKEMREAADLYMKQHDNKIGGKDAKLIVADSGGDPESGKSKAKEMVLKDKVDVITGIVASPVAVTVAQEAESQEVPVVMANAGANELTEGDVSKYIWRTAHSNHGHGYASGVYAAEHQSKTGGVFMGADYSAGTEYLGGFKDGYAEKGGEDLLKEILTPFGKTQNYQPFLGQIPDDAKFVDVFYAGGEAITFQKNWADFGYKDKFPLLGAEDLTDETILDALGDAGEGTIAIGMYYPDLDNDANNKLTDAWDEEYDGVPSIIAVTQYDAMTMIDEAVKNVDGDVSGESMADAFGSVKSIESPRGDFKIDEKSHDPIQNYYATKLVKDGSDWKYELLATIEDVTG